MIESILIALGVLGSGGVYYFMNKRVNALESKVSKAESEAIVAKGYQQNAEEKVIELQKTYTNFVENAKSEIEKTKVSLEEKYKKESDLKVEKVIQDYEEALKLETEDLEEKVAQLDEQLGEKIQEIAAKNTMRFTCACDRTKYIPCTIDLSEEENYFTCPDCGAVYKVVISASTILMSGITNNPKIANMYDGVEVGEIDRTPL
jgi:F0F1-type ATP synthase membrane subunit b/b'